MTKKLRVTINHGDKNVKTCNHIFLQALQRSITAKSCLNPSRRLLNADSENIFDFHDRNYLYQTSMQAVSRITKYNSGE